MKRRTFLGSSVCAIMLPSIGFGADEQNATALAGDRFEIDDQEYFLTDIVAPVIVNAGPPAPYAQQAKSSLAAILKSPFTDIRQIGPDDRWGRMGVLAISDASGDGLSVQELLVREGSARVYPQSDETQFIRQLLALEDEARQREKGLWAHGEYAVRSSDHADDAVGSYHLVEGTVLNVTETRSRTYVNFGKDYRTDFTVTAASKIRRHLSDVGLDLESLAGKTIRTRGFLAWINGPSIELDHALQVEVL